MLIFGVYLLLVSWQNDTCSEMRLQAQKPACKDLGGNDQNLAITAKTAYTPFSNCASARFNL